jgi:hypothetical protein
MELEDKSIVEKCLDKALKELEQAKIELVHGTLNQREDAESIIPFLEKEIKGYQIYLNKVLL